MNQTNTIDLTFNFFDFNFIPYKGEENTLSATKIFGECIGHINKVKVDDGNAILINRNEGRKDASKRNLFVSSAAISLPEKKYKCKMALLREDRIPELVNKTDYSLTSMILLNDQAIAETTHFYVDFSGDVPVVCCEFNHLGPRVSDIEYYFRQISNKILRISKKCEASIHMKLSVNEVLSSLRDVLKFDLKVRPNMLSYLYQDVQDSFVTNMSALARTVDPNFIRVEAFFREMGNGSKSQTSNKAVNFVKKILSAVRKDENVIDEFEDFNLTFENNAGAEQVFSLIKGKQEIIVTCEIVRPGIPRSRDLNEKVTVKFDEYLLERKS